MKMKCKKKNVTEKNPHQCLNHLGKTHSVAFILLYEVLAFSLLAITN